MNFEVTASTVLADWNKDWIEEILNRNLQEGSFYDFKASLKDDSGSIAKTVAAFGNTLGGFIVFGIQDYKECSGWSRLLGVDETEFSKQLNDKVQYIEPHIQLDDPSFIEISNQKVSRVIAVVYVNSRIGVPYGFINRSSNLVEFWERGNQTNMPMSYPSIQLAMKNSHLTQANLKTLLREAIQLKAMLSDLIVAKTDQRNTYPMYCPKSLMESEWGLQIIHNIPDDTQLANLVFAIRIKMENVRSNVELLHLSAATCLPIIPEHNRIIGDKFEAGNIRITTLIERLSPQLDELIFHLVKEYPQLETCLHEWVQK